MKLPIAILLIALVSAGATYRWQSARESELRAELDALRESPNAVDSVPDTSAPTNSLENLGDTLVQHATALLASKSSYGMFDELELEVAGLSEPQLLKLLANDPSFEFVKELYESKPPALEWAHDQVLWHAYKRLMETSPRRGLELTVKSGLSPSKTSSLQNPVRAALHVWAQRDIDAAWNFLEQNAGQFAMFARRKSRLVRSLAEVDVAAAIAAAQRFEALDDAMPSIAMSLRTSDDRALFFETLAELPDAETRRQKYVEAFADRIENSVGFASVREFLEQEVVDFQMSNELVLKLALKDVSSGAEEKAAWLVGASAPEEREANLRQFVEAWATEDFRAVAMWLGENREETWRDSAVAAYAATIRDLDPVERDGLMLQIVGGN